MTVNISRVDDFIWRRIGDEIAIIKDDGLALHLLNKTAAHIWELCDGTKNTDDIAASICERFDVTYEEASADVNSTIDQLRELGLLD